MIPSYYKKGLLQDVSLLWLLWDLIRPWKWHAALNITSNTLSALFEGSTFGILAVALQVLADSGPTLASSLGSLGGWLDAGVRQYGRDALFLGLVLLAILAQFLRSGFQFIAETASVHLQSRVHARAFQRVYARLLRMPFPRFNAYPLGDLTHTLGQTQSVNDAVGRLNEMARTALMVLSYTAILLWISWPMTLAAAAGYLLISRIFRRILQTVLRHAQGMSDASAQLSQRATEFLQASRLLHSFARREESIRTVQRLAEGAVAHQRRATLWCNSIEPISDTLTVAGAGVFLLGGYLALGRGGEHALPGLLAFLIALYRVTPRLRALHTNMAMITSLLPGLARVRDILNQPQEARGGSLEEYPGGHREILFREVTLQYLPEEPPAVMQLSFGIRRGSFIALVGSSGAGKSSVADLLLRLYDPSSGQILVDGTDLRRYTNDSWRRQIAVVPQDPFLFHQSIEENIRFGRPDAALAEVVAAAQAAHAHDFIERLAQGYGTVVGDRGYRLSGGQCQRIALARALLRQPELLILDEATSSLDSESERLIQRALNEQRGSRTIVAIAHRLSTIAGADSILVLAEGRRVEQGTHAELLQRGGIYARLWRMQSHDQTQEVAG